MRTFQLSILMLLFGAAVCHPLAATERMNVVFILADDLGYSDTTLYGTTSLYQTPNIERLAARGMTFGRAYANSPLCSPTRASIMTGQTPARHGSSRPEHHKGEVRLKPTVEPEAKPGNKVLGIQTVTRLDTALPTLGKMIKKGGYATGHFGKWHLGPEPYSPLEHGFDVDIPHSPSPGPAGSYLAPWRFANDLQPQTKGEHIEDRMASEAIQWMNGLPKNKPFFMNYWQFSVHAPFDAKPELVEKYRRLVDPDSRQRSPTYAAMVESCDDAVGALLDAVDSAGIADRTIIIFTSDNGGNVHQEIPADGAPVTSNFPLIGGKAVNREGGVRVPCVVVWPRVTRPGSRSDEIIQTSDFYTTLLENLGMGLPKNHRVDGIDLMPALQGGKLERDGIFTYFPVGMPGPDWLPPSISVHSGDWKLYRLFHGGDNEAHDYRLYNLASDIGENSDLASAHPEKVRTLDRLIEDHLQDAQAIVPLPNPDFDPAQYQPERIGLTPQQWNSGARREKNPDAKSTGISPAETTLVADARPSDSVEGWTAGGACSLFHTDGSLIVKCAGGGSNVRTLEAKPRKGGPFTLKLRVKSTASGKSSLLYNKPSRETLVSFPLEHDGRFHEYEVKLPALTLKMLRINPTKAEGVVQFDWIRVLNNSGEAVRSWEFGNDATIRNAPARKRRQRQERPDNASVPTDDERSDRTADQSQDLKIDVYADHTNQWTGKRNTVWNSWHSHQAHGYAFLRDPDGWMAERWNPGQLKNVRIMGGLKDPTKHRWMLGVKDGEPVCDFTGLIEILSAELEHGLKPGIVLDQIPWEIAVRTAPGPPSAKTMKYWNPKYGNDGPAADYDLWKKYVKQFLNACIDAFGYEEVSSWQFRVATEPDNAEHWGGTWEKYKIHYDHTVQAVTELIPNAWIGPGNFIAAWLADPGNERQLGTVEDFIHHCVHGKNHATGETGTRMTFLAFSAYTMSASPVPNAKRFDLAFRKARALIEKFPELNAYLDNPAMPGWFAIELHEYGDLPSLRGEYLWMTEWMAGYHAHMLDLAYSHYGIFKTSFWFQNQGYRQWYPYVRVSQMLSEMEGGALVEVRKLSESEIPKVKHGAISAWKDGSLYVLIYNWNWDPLHQGTLRGERNHTIDNTTTLNITGDRIAAHAKWSLDHKIINEKSGNGSWYHALRAELDDHPDLEAVNDFYHVQRPKQGWKGPVEEIVYSRGKYAKNGVHEKYQKLSEVGIVGTDMPVNASKGTITFTSEPFTQSGVQLLKFTPAE